MTTTEAIRLLDQRAGGPEKYGERVEELTVQAIHKANMGDDSDLNLLDEFEDALERDDKKHLATIMPAFRERYGQDELEKYFAYWNIR